MALPLIFCGFSSLPSPPHPSTGSSLPLLVNYHTLSVTPIPPL